MSLLESFCGLKCVRISRIAYLLNLSSLKTVVSRKFISSSEISAVNLIVGWRLFARTINSSISFLSTFRSENVTDVSFPLKWSKSVLLYYCLTEYAKPDQCLSLTKILIIRFRSSQLIIVAFNAAIVKLG